MYETDQSRIATLRFIAITRYIYKYIYVYYTCTRQSNISIALDIVCNNNNNWQVPTMQRYNNIIQVTKIIFYYNECIVTRKL